MGEEALGTGVGVSIRKTWRASQIIADEGRVVGNRGFVLGTGGGGRVEGWEAAAASCGSSDCQVEAFTSHSPGGGSH